MKNQTLSIKQMQYLQKLGVDTSNASMVLIATDNEGYDLDWEEALEYVNSKEQEVYFSLFDAETGDYDHSCRENCGVFTLQDVIDKLPKFITPMLSDTLTLGIIREKDSRLLKGAIYYFALYDKSLTPEEVEEEKVKLENYWEGGKNELA